ncbi:MAG: acyltransferase [Chthoniobacteraceae bacterium]
MASELSARAPPFRHEYRGCPRPPDIAAGKGRSHPLPPPITPAITSLLSPNLAAPGLCPEDSRPPGSEPRFVPRIESLRGVAAFMVAVFHSFTLLPVGGVEKFYLRRIFELDGAAPIFARLLTAIFSGGAAVSLFFVISGYVLRLALKRDTREAAVLATSFISRRFLRIYPALAVNLCVMFAVLWAAHLLRPGLFTNAPAPFALIENLALTRISINGVTWTLLVEFIAVPFILFAHLLTRRFGLRVLLAFTAYLTLAIFQRKFLLVCSPFNGFLFMFAFGMLVADFAPARMARLSSCDAGKLLVLGVVLLLGARLFTGYASRWSILLEGIGGLLVVSIVACGPSLRPLAWLDYALVRSLGRISYSFYLYHPVFLVVIVSPVVLGLVPAAVLAKWPLSIGLLVALITIPPAWLAAKLSFRFVEQGALRIGRKKKQDGPGK